MLGSRWVARAVLVVLAAGCALPGLLAVASPASPASAAQAAQPAAVGVAVTPAELIVAPLGTATGVMTLANSGSAPVTATVRPTASDPSIKVTLTPADQLVTIPGGATVALTFTVERTGLGSGQDAVVGFVVTYQRDVAGAAVAQASVATLTVKATPSTAIVEVAVQSNVELINENRPGHGFLVVTNPREAEVRVDAVEVSAPASTTVTVDCLGRSVQAADGATASGCSFTIAPRQQVVLPLTLAAASSVTPGPRSATFRVLASDARNGGAAVTASVVVSTAFTIDVFAESEILQAVGVPVLLVLPGVIIVLTAWFLFRAVGPWRRVAGEVKLEGVVSAATLTAVLGVAISLVVAKVYPWLTQHLYPGERRDYLQSYGFVDFYYVFGYGFAIAVAFWAVLSITWPLWRWLFVPSEGDAPEALLRKLGLRGPFGGGTVFPRMTVGDPGMRGLRLGGGRGDQVLVGPRIQVTAPNDLRTAIEEHVSNGRAFRLWRAVAGSAGTTLSYKPSDVEKVRAYPRDDVTPGGSSDPIVEIVPDGGN